MIEVSLIEYLNGKLDVEVYCERPKVAPKSYVIIEKTSESESNFLRSCMIAIQSYASTLYDAMNLNEKVIQVMKDAHEISNVFGVHLNSSYNFTDDSTKEYRYQSVYDINYML